MAKIAYIICMMQMPTDPGTYILILSLSGSHEIVIGKLGALNFLPGWYAYVGSAMGPGGLAARINRHLKTKKKMHWHIDYLRPFTSVIGAVVASGKEKKEHQWATNLNKPPFPGTAINDFGCTDCNCRSHLFRFSQPFDPFGLSLFLKAQWFDRLPHL